jgi:hypothetical protein
MNLFDPFLYEKIHLLVILAFTIFYYYIIQQKQASGLIKRTRSRYGIFVYAILFIVVVGFRPVSRAFVDTVIYARTYYAFSNIPEGIAYSRDALFYSFMWLCSQYISVNWFFLIVEAIYVIPIMIGCYRLLGKNADIGLVFCFAAFSFFSYGVNGIRNGASLSLVFMAISFIRGNKLEMLFSLVLCIVALFIHASAALPVVCMIAALLIKEPKVFYSFWVLSIVLSLVAGDYVSNLFASVGFDDRLSDYLLVDVDEDVFSHVGFRWDFLLYSSVPLLLGWYIIFKKRILDSTYLLLLGTYILSNSFWIMIIRAEFSNRFAYLSWFLYPIVLAYPLLKLRIWPRTQGIKTAIIMAGHFAFTFMMAFIL